MNNWSCLVLDFARRTRASSPIIHRIIYSGPAETNKWYLSALCKNTNHEAWTNERAPSGECQAHGDPPLRSRFARVCMQLCAAGICVCKLVLIIAVSRVWSWDTCFHNSTSCVSSPHLLVVRDSPVLIPTPLARGWDEPRDLSDIAFRRRN